MNEALSRDLEARKQSHLYRSRLVGENAQQPIRQVDGKTLLSFCSNDYLGLANHPDVITAFKRGADQWGVGSGASHLVSGHSSPHHALEIELSEFLNRERSLLFSSGYAANLGTISALLGRQDAVFGDKLNHASLIDAGQLSRATVKRYRHCDLQSLEQQLSRTPARRKLVVTDSVFSMDGDIAPLRDMADVARQHDAWLMIDDAHGFGVLGESGAGTCEALGLSADDVPIVMGTLGKAMGTFGAFVAGSDALIETLIQHARTYIYTTALPPAVAEATRASLRLLKGESWRRDKLNQLIQYFRNGAEQLGLPLLVSQTAIQGIVVGDAAAALKCSEILANQNILVTAIRPPTVPEGTARLRITLSAAHEISHIDKLLVALSAIKLQ